MLKPPTNDSPFVFTKGALVREAVSDGDWFLAELARVLAAKEVPKNPDAVERLEFDAAVLGTELSRQAGADQLAGSFTSQPPGHWIATKVFVADGEGEFFLNLNPAGGWGEISIKDEEYGDAVIEALAPILAGKKGA